LRSASATRWTSAAFPLAGLASAIGMEPSALSRALAAKRNFGSLEVALIAEQLGIPTDVLLADDDRGPRTMAVAARLGASKSVAVDQAIAQAVQISDLDHLLTEVGHGGDDLLSFPPLPDKATPFEQGERLAVAVRRQIGKTSDDLPPEPDDLASWVEQFLRVDVCIFPLPPGLDGLAVTAGRLRLALVSSGISATRQRFTLAHEVGHLVAGDAQDLKIDEDIFGRQASSEEKRANAFDAAFLIPRAALREAIADRPLDEDLVSDLLGRFRVSLDALAYRLQNVGLVRPEERDRIRRLASARIANRPGRADDLKARNERRMPGRLLDRAFRAFSAGDLGIEPLARLVGAEPEQLLDELTPPRFSETLSNSDDPVYAL
jgi:Zn-dependent peptidase ImmA (M78 family)